MDLKSWLNLNDMTQVEISRGIGVHPRTINNYLAGARRPNSSIGLKIEKFTKREVTIQDLMDNWERKNAGK